MAVLDFLFYLVIVYFVSTFFWLQYKYEGCSVLVALFRTFMFVVFVVVGFSVGLSILIVSWLF